MVRCSNVMVQSNRCILDMSKHYVEKSLGRKDNNCSWDPPE